MILHAPHFVSRFPADTIGKKTRCKLRHDAQDDGALGSRNVMAYDAVRPDEGKTQLFNHAEKSRHALGPLVALVPYPFSMSLCFLPGNQAASQQKLPHILSRN